MQWRWLVVICLAPLALGGSGCSRDVALVSESPVVSASHAKMLAVLEDVRKRTADEHPFLGTRVLREAEQALAAARQFGTPSPDDLSRLHGVYGEELLRAGRAPEGVKEIEQALTVLPDDAGHREIRKAALYRLAVACMRLGENSNCVYCSNGASCILPIRGEGVHADKTGSQQAAAHLLTLLQQDPQNLSAIWLLNIAHMTLGTYPEGVPEEYRIPPAVFASTSPDVPVFRNIASSLKLDTRSPAGSVILDDFDGDDDFDIVTSSSYTGEQLRYFRNNGDGTFTETTRESNLEGIFGGLNLIQADYDNDGDLDVLVMRGAWLEEHGRHPRSLLQNDGTGRFTDVTFDVGLAEVFYPGQTAGWADVENDGDLDLYCGNEQYPSQLFENDGRGRFTEITSKAGVVNDRLAKGSSWGDYNNDRLPDLYVSNLPGENRLYRNNGDGTFTDVAPELGMVKPIQSFPCWFWDYDNDGQLDLYVASFEAGSKFVAADYLGRPVTCEPDCFYRGLGDGRFEEVAAQLGFTRVTQPMGSNFGDLNNDGFADMYLGTGYVDYDGLIPNLLFLNRGGRQFEDVTFAAGVGHLQKGHGVALGDLDSDGDLDIFAQMGGWFIGDAFQNAVFENPGNNAHWLEVKLTGTRSNRSAIGARMRVVLGTGERERSIYRWVNSGGSFGANPLRQHFGLGAETVISRLEVYWPTSDTTQVFEDIAVDQRLEITEGQQTFRVMPLRPVKFAAPSTPVAAAGRR